MRSTTRTFLRVVFALALCASAACSAISSTGSSDEGDGGHRTAGDADPFGDAGCGDDCADGGAGGDVGASGFHPCLESENPVEECPCVDGAVKVCYSGPEGTANVGECRHGRSVCDRGDWLPCEHDRLPEEEVCDYLDNDCDGSIDEGVLDTCASCTDTEDCTNYFDDDCNGIVNDGCGCTGRTSQPCYSGPPRTAGVGTCRGGILDCACPPGDLFCEPGEGSLGECIFEVLPAEEICDGLDNDCDGAIDEGVSNACHQCREETPVEICDGMDNDCDGLTDEGVVLSCGLCVRDVTAEMCDDRADNDCDGLIDEDCRCDEAEVVPCYPGDVSRLGIGACTEGILVCEKAQFTGLCAGAVLPGIEVCNDLDDDCNGVVDEEAIDAPVYYADLDGDGFGDPYSPLAACSPPARHVLDHTDCDDTRSESHPGALELCDYSDTDCDGMVDEGVVNSCGTCGEPCYIEPWENPEDWEDNDLARGLDDDFTEGLRLPDRLPEYADLWVANSDEGTVTRIDTDSGEALGTFTVGLPGIGNAPSRTAVDLDGNAWVANRAFGGQGSITKLRGGDCRADCVEFTVPVGGHDHLPRGLAVDADNNVWVGTYNGQQLHRFNTAIGSVDRTYDVGTHVYGLAIDSTGLIWASSVGDYRITCFDPIAESVCGTYPIPGDCPTYGIAVDREGNVWAATWSCSGLARFDRESFDAGGSHFDHYTLGGMDGTRGVAVDIRGHVWVAASGSNTLSRFDPVSESFGDGAGGTALYALGCASPIGVGVARDQDIWAVCHGSSRAVRVGPDGTIRGGTGVGAGPYSYSDMTGFQLRTFTARGTWRDTFDCGFEDCRFDSVSWVADIPPGVGTGVGVRVRAGLTIDELLAATWSEQYVGSPAEFAIFPYRYLQVEVQLWREGEETPVVSDVDVAWQRP